MAEIQLEGAWRELQAVANGERDAHVWISDRYPSTPLLHRFCALGEQVDEESHGLPPAFADAIEVRYGGILSPTTARARISAHLGALGISETVE